MLIIISEREVLLFPLAVDVVGDGVGVGGGGGGVSS